MATCNTQTLIDRASCFACISPSFLYPLKIALLRSILLASSPSADVTPQGLIDRASCFACLTPGILQVLRIQLLCNILTSLAGSPCGTPTTTLQSTGAGTGNGNATFTEQGDGSWLAPDLGFGVSSLVLVGGTWQLKNVSIFGTQILYTCPNADFPCGPWVAESGLLPPPNFTYI